MQLVQDLVDLLALHLHLNTGGEQLLTSLTERRAN